MIGWHHWLSGHEFEQVQGDSEEQGSLAYCSPWGHKQSEMAEWLNNNKCISGLPEKLDDIESAYNAGWKRESESRSVVTNSLWTHGLWTARFLYSWNSPGKNTGVGKQSFLQFIFLIHDLNRDLLYCRWILYQLSYHGSNSGKLGSIPGQEDPLEEGMATHSCILAWKIPWTVQLGTHTHTHISTNA